MEMRDLKLKGNSAMCMWGMSGWLGESSVCVLCLYDMYLCVCVCVLCACMTCIVCMFVGHVLCVYLFSPQAKFKA